jgi:hypothetical protein
MKITVTELAVHPEGANLMFGEKLTRIRLDDDNTGYFLTFIQETENRGMQQLQFGFDEIEHIIKAAEQLKEIVTILEG